MSPHARPSPADLIAYTLGHLPPTERERMQALLAVDRDLAREQALVAAHLDRWSLLERAPTPAPPPAEQLLAALRATRGAEPPDARDTGRGDTGRQDTGVAGAGPLIAGDALARGGNGLAGSRRRTRRAAWFGGALLGAAVLLVAFGVLRPDRSAPDPGVVGRSGAGLAIAREAVSSPLQGNAGDAVRIGDRLRADRPAEAFVADGRVRVVLDAGTELRVLGRERVALLGGRAFFEVAPGPFVVETAPGPVTVRGTAFEVAYEGEEVAVRVAEGAVDAWGAHVEGGSMVSSRSPIATADVVPFSGVLGAWFRRPTLRLNATPVEDVDPGRSINGGIRLTLTLENLTHLPVSAGPPDPVRTALWLNVEGPDGSVRDVPLPMPQPAAAWLEATSRPLEAGASRHGEVVLVEPFDREGVYRCRAMYRPESEAPLVSPDIEVEVR